MQEVVRTALSALYEAASHQSDRIAKLELDVKQKANKEDVNVALAQKASAFGVASRLKQVRLEHVVYSKMLIFMLVWRPQTSRVAKEWATHANGPFPCTSD